MLHIHNEVSSVFSSIISWYNGENDFSIKGEMFILAAKARILRACQQVKKPCYIFTTKAEEAAACLDDGYAGVAHELDFDILIEAYRHVVTDIRSFQGKRY